MCSIPAPWGPGAAPGLVLVTVLALTLEDTKTACELAAHYLQRKKGEKEERENFRHGVKTVQNINSNVSLTKRSILLQCLWFTMHEDPASNKEQVKWRTSKPNKSIRNNPTCETRAASPGACGAFKLRTGLLSVFHVCRPLCASLWGPHLRPH